MLRHGNAGRKHLPYFLSSPFFFTESHFQPRLFLGTNSRSQKRRNHLSPGTRLALAHWMMIFSSLATHQSLSNDTGQTNSSCYLSRPHAFDDGNKIFRRKTLNEIWRESNLRSFHPRCVRWAIRRRNRGPQRVRKLISDEGGIPLSRV